MYTFDVLLLLMEYVLQHSFIVNLFPKNHQGEWMFFIMISM